MELKPRLCFLTREERGYGFHLHGERNKGGQFIRKVEPGSPADLSGLRAGDRVVEVNGENVENETHYQVVNLIRAVAHRTRLLVVDKETDEHLRARHLPVTEDGAVETGNLSPRPSPMSTPSASPLPRESAPWSPFCGRAHSPVQPVADALCPAPKPRPISSLLQHPAVSRKIGRPSLTSDPGDATELSSEMPSQLPGATVELLPRVCHMVRGEHGYGFNLHSDKTRDGQFIRSVDPCSPAARADLRPQDRLVEVNGVSVEGLKHSDVVGLIHGGQEETSLLVVDPETDELFRTLGVTPASCHVREVYVDEPIVTQTIMSEPIVAKTIMSEPIVTKTIMIEPIVAKPVVKEPIGAKPFVNEPIVNEPIKGEAIVAEPIGNDPTENEPITNETILEDPIGDSALLTPSPTGTFKSRGPPPVINVTISNSPSSRSPKLRTYGSSGSQSSRSSTTQSELSSSDTSIPVPDEDERRVSDHFLESGLRLSPTAAEAKERARAKRTKKRAPPMDWSQKQQIFSNL